MRSLPLVFVLTLSMLVPVLSAAQSLERQGSGAGSGSGSGSSSSGSGTSTRTVTTDKGATYTVTTSDQEKTGAKPQMAIEPPAGRWVRTLTNVQVELTITDQAGTGTPEKKVVSMVVSSGSWGKIRSAQMVRDGGRDQVVDLNVDARPFVSVEGPIQLELTVVFSPPGTQTGDVVRLRPTGVNQSLTVILQSGKPLVISQAADPIGDRKIIVEAKATVLK
jgi:hypothetical protein